MRIADCAMFTAWSPMRSRSPLIRETASRKRKIGRHGRLQRQQALHALVNLDLHLVDGVFFAEHGFGKVLFGVQHRVHGLMDRALGEAPHPQQPLLQFFEIVFEMSFHGSSVPSRQCQAPSRQTVCVLIRSGR